MANNGPLARQEAISSALNRPLTTAQQGVSDGAGPGNAPESWCAIEFSTCTNSPEAPIRGTPKCCPLGVVLGMVGLPAIHPSTLESMTEAQTLPAGLGG